MSSPSSSPPPSTPSPPFSPFSSLPFELAEYIIEATLPLRDSLSTYRDRKKTLLSLCLVSRLFHQISKPLLFAVVLISKWIKSSRLSNHEEEEVDSSSQTRELIFYYTGVDVEFDDLRHIFRTQLHITKVVLLDVPGEVNFGTLSQMNHLSILRLFDVTITATSPFILPRLSELSWGFVKATESWSSNFDSRSFPSLRTVSISAVPERTETDLAEKILKAFSTQLDVIALDANLLSQLSPELVTCIKQKTLVEIGPSLPKLTNHASYLRIRTSEPSLTATYTELIRYVEKLPSLSCSTLLYLPRYLSDLDRENDWHKASMQSLLDQCSARKVAVVFEEQFYDWSMFKPVSPDFCRRVTEKDTTRAIK